MFLDPSCEPQAVQDAFLLGSQLLFRELAQEFLDKYILIFQENILIDAYSPGTQIWNGSLNVALGQVFSLQSRSAGFCSSSPSARSSSHTGLPFTLPKWLTWEKSSRRGRRSQVRREMPLNAGKPTASSSNGQLWRGETLSAGPSHYFFFRNATPSIKSSTCSLCKDFPFLLANSHRSLAATQDGVKGHSIRTCFPAFRIAWCSPSWLVLSLQIKATRLLDWKEHLPEKFAAPRQCSPAFVGTRPIRFRNAEEACDSAGPGIQTEPALPTPTATTPNFLSGSVFILVCFCRSCR